MHRSCECFAPAHSNVKWAEMVIHADTQDRNSEAWRSLLNLIDEAAEDRREVFDPKKELGAELWGQIEVLPKEISKLKNIKHLLLYGSSLSRIPQEIGEMEALEEFTPYTSYKLHYFPYEITKCKKLKSSTVSTRALYGNHKNFAPFPRLKGNPVQSYDNPKCSICQKTDGVYGLSQVWVSCRVATDVLPLLVYTCSKECVEKIPSGANGYIAKHHKGGIGLYQPGKK